MLNEKAKSIYMFIKESIEDGYPPTVREICSALGIKSTSTVHGYINTLAEEGYLEKLDNCNRTIKLTNVGKALKIPVIKNVEYCTSATSFKNITGYITYTSDKGYLNPLFAFKHKGNSMESFGILDGDMIIAEQTAKVSEGDIIMELSDGNITVNKYNKENHLLRLQTEKFVIIGKAIALLRNL